MRSRAFRYNCVSLGLAAYAALFVVLGAHRVLTASFSISASAAASSPTSTAATRTPTLTTRRTQPAPVNGVGSVFGGGFFVGVAQCALGSALFTLALCYKQMSLYLALAFFSLLAALALRLAFRSFAAGYSNSNSNSNCYCSSASVYRIYTLLYCSVWEMSSIHICLSRCV